MAHRNIRHQQQRGIAPAAENCIEASARRASAAGGRRHRTAWLNRASAGVDNELVTTAVNRAMARICSARRGAWHSWCAGGAGVYGDMARARARYARRRRGVDNAMDSAA